MIWSPAFDAYARFGHHDAVGWVAAMVVHGVVYQTIWQLMRGMSTAECLVLATVVVLGFLLWQRGR